MRPDFREACKLLLGSYWSGPDSSLLQYEEDYDLHEHMYFNLGAIDGLTAPIQPENFIHANFGKSIALGELQCPVFCIPHAGSVQ